VRTNPTINLRQWEKRAVILLRRILQVLFGDFEAHVFHQKFDIFPDVAFFAGVTQDVGWVIGTEDFDFTLRMKLPT
jgi:hypothetical protein